MQNDILTPKAKPEREMTGGTILTPKPAPTPKERAGEGEPVRKNKFGTMNLIQEEKRTSVIDGLLDPAAVFGKANTEALDRKFAEKEKEFWKESTKKNKP